MEEATPRTAGPQDLVQCPACRQMTQLTPGRPLDEEFQCTLCDSTFTLTTGRRRPRPIIVRPSPRVGERKRSPTVLIAAAVVVLIVVAAVLASLLRPAYRVQDYQQWCARQNQALSQPGLLSWEEDALVVRAGRGATPQTAGQTAAFWGNRFMETFPRAAALTVVVRGPGGGELYRMPYGGRQ